MSDPSPDASRRLRLRYPATCSDCGVPLSARTEAFWDPIAKRVTCLACADAVEVLDTTGTAGVSARARGEMLASRATRRARERWGEHAAAVAARIAPEDASIRAWTKGGAGERSLAAFIDRELGDAVIGLHDRVIPGARNQNIDHLFVAPTGVWVVDAKAYKGNLEKRDAGSFWRSDPRVFIAGRDRTKLVDGMELQVKAVRAALEPDPAFEHMALHPALCFVESDWGLLQRSFEIRGVSIMYPGALRSRLKKDGPLSRQTMERIAKRLELSLPSVLD